MQNLPQAVKEWALNSTLHGCRHLAEDNRHWLEKVIWWLVQFAALGGIISTTLDVYDEYMQTPVVTSLATNQYPAWLVPFPAVALCNINKLSKRKVQELAVELMSESQTNYTLEKLTRELQKLGHMYDINLSGFAGIQDLSYALRNYENNITGLLHRLAPSCEELLVRCQWKGRNRACHELFHQKETIQGICCIFNAHDGTSKAKQPETLHATGHRSGLEVLVDPNPDDYYYPVFPTYGTQVYIFKPFDYPDTANGMIEYVVSKQREVFYTINPFSTYTTSELQGFSSANRGCTYMKETHTNCLSACVFAVILETCRCLPFYVQNRGHAKVCDLTDIPCLSRNKDKFQHSREDLGSAFCSHCLPACTDTWYDVQSSYAKIAVPQTQPRFSILNGLEVNENHSMIHVYYQTLDTTLYKQDVLYTRTELVSNIGGICSLFNGFSFLSLVEILYFLTMRWYFMGRMKDQENATAEGKVEERDVNSPAPYWSEFGVQVQQPSLGPGMKFGTLDWHARKIVLGKRIEFIN